MTPQDVILYTRRDCHLCEDAKVILLRFGLSPREVDIDQEEDLLRQFNECVPVVEINGKIRFRGRINEVLLRRILG